MLRTPTADTRNPQMAHSMRVHEWIGLGGRKDDLEREIWMVEEPVFGAIAGDVIGSVYEFTGIKTIAFPLFSRETTFTDDSVMTAAVAAALLEGRDYASVFREFGRRHPGRGYGSFSTPG